MSQLLQYYKSFQQSRNPNQNITPTFEDLSIDDNLTEIQRLVKYAKSSIGLQRLVQVKMLANIANSVGFAEAKTKIIPLLEPFSVDTEPAVKQHLVEQLSPLAKFCASYGEEGYGIIVGRILPITAKLLEDDKPEVRQAACTTLVNVAHLVLPDDLGQNVLTIILRLAHEDDKEEMRMTASELLNSLAECLGSDLCKQFVIPEVVSLAEDPVFRVRKSTALNFHNICKVGGEHELFERLMPAFVRLSKDDMYRVRRACAESLWEIAQFVSDDIRIGVLVEIFLRLAQDPSRVVKQSVLQQSGMFIATLPGRVVSEAILSNFCSMASMSSADGSSDPDLRHFCAYSLPAVLQTVGAARWKELRALYQTLVQCRSVSVRQTLASSLHEVARVLGGGAVVEEELVPVFEEFIQDVEAVQMGVIKYLAEFLRLLSEPLRKSYLPLLHDILHSTNPFNWRLRQSLASQLPELIMLPAVEDLYATLFPLVMTLLQDPVASVRRDSYKGVVKMLLMLSEQAELQAKEGLESPSVGRRTYASQLESVIKSVNTLYRGDTFQIRQLWVELSHRLLRDLPRHFFEKHFIEGILVLTSDSVTNVRVAVAVMLGGWDSEDIAPWEEPTLSESEINAAVAAAEAARAPPVASTTSVVNLLGTVTHQPALPPTPPLGSRPSPWAWLMQRADIRNCIARLSRDDRDVCINVSKLQPLFPDLIFTSISCRGYKTAPGGGTPVALDSGTAAEEKIVPSGRTPMALDGGIAVEDTTTNTVVSQEPTSSPTTAQETVEVEETLVASEDRKLSEDCLEPASEASETATAVENSVRYEPDSEIDVMLAPTTAPAAAPVAAPTSTPAPTSPATASSSSSSNTASSDSSVSNVSPRLASGDKDLDDLAAFLDEVVSLPPVAPKTAEQASPGSPLPPPSAQLSLLEQELADVLSTDMKPVSVQEDVLSNDINPVSAQENDDSAAVVVEGAGVTAGLDERVADDAADGSGLVSSVEEQVGSDHSARAHEDSLNNT